MNGPQRTAYNVKQSYWLLQGVAMRLHDVTMQIILNPQLGGLFDPHLTTFRGGAKFQCTEI